MEYLIQQPRSLETLAIDRLGQWILSQGTRISEIQHDVAKAQNLLSQQIESIQNYLRKLPNIYHDKLATVLTLALNKIERSIDLKFTQKYTIGRMIETVFSKNLTCLSLYSQIYFGSLSKSYMLTGLVDLTFSPGSWSDDATNIEDDTIKFLKELHNLKYLDLSYCNGICNIDNILGCIADNCKLIEVLNLCSLECLNDDIIDLLTRLNNLRRVDLRETGVSEKGVETLLTSCRTIEYIITDDNEVALALENIATSDEHLGEKFKLISYENHRETTLEQLQLVVALCPLIQKISLTKYETANHLAALNDLQDLRELELYGFEFYEDQVNYFLEQRGCNIVNVHFEDVEQIDLKALICISETCPNLESLSFEDCVFEKEQTSTLGHGLFQCQKPVFKTCAFKNLRSLSLKKLRNSMSEPSEEQLFFLLSTCPNVERITTSRIPLTDGLMLKVLDVNPLTYLEELNMRHQNRPATLVIDRIVQNSVALLGIYLNRSPF